MGKISELLKPSTWSLLLVDEKKQELLFQIAIGKDASRIRDFRSRLEKDWPAGSQKPVKRPS
jgi:hypothetical protein